MCGEFKNRALRWLLWTSIQKIDMFGTIKLTSLPKSVRREYNQLGSFYSYSFSNAPISTRERFNSCCLYSSRSSNVHLSAFMCSKNVFRVGSDHQRSPFYSECSSIWPGENLNWSRKTPCYDSNWSSFVVRSSDRSTGSQTACSWCFSPEWFGPGNKRFSSSSQRRISRGPRELFRLCWKHRSKARSSKPRLSCETITLIGGDGSKQPASSGLSASVGNALSLDIRVSKRTIQKYMKQVRVTSSPWADLENVPAQSYSRGVGGVGLWCACRRLPSSFVHYLPSTSSNCASRRAHSCECDALSHRRLDRTYRFGKPLPMVRVRSISSVIVITSLDPISRALPQPAASRYWKRLTTHHGPMRSVNAF